MTKSSPFTGIKVCAFDAYGTLFDLGSLADRVRGSVGDRADALVSLWRRKQLEYTWLRTVIGRHTDFWHVTGESLDYAMATLRIANPILRSRLMEAWLTPRAYGDVADALSKVQRAGIKTVILSNGSPSMLVGATGAAGLSKLVDTVLSVEKVGVYKPHASVYKLVCEEFGIGPKDVGFVSGNGWDAAGAAGFGFRVAWVNRTGAPAEILPDIPDAEISGLDGLAALLGH